MLLSRVSRLWPPRFLLLTLIAGYAALGCASVAARDVPAVIVQPTVQSRQALQLVVSQALKRESVRLSDDALTQNNVLIIESARVRDPQGQVIYDRDPSAVEHFHLVRSWWRCVLVRESTKMRYKLAHTKCQPKS